ncbi:efflux RND transporter periplasmic adaptor subunit [Methyloversatilis thermotolerans]|uniref:efflux RND transporter periplasmic adaptor subunit n=1 Tax=Methyloversatilis thermotolerans TaxID=1346290 RepID=UPI0004762AF3|nr:efflux RND transporter periplasmic adaptor subunit [Methyloversatilis thermotolerans]
MSPHRSASPVCMLFLSSCVALLSTACSAPKEDDPRIRPPRVAVITAQAAADGPHRYSGVIAARVQGDLSFRVTGKVIERLVDTGQAVRRGQALMKLDAADLSLARQAQAAAVAAARARAVQARADLARLDGLVEQGAISAQARDLAVAAADSAQATLEAAEAQWQVSRNAADYAVLVADADGVVVDTLAEPGQVVRAGEPVLRLAHAGRREVLVHLPENVRPPVGTKAEVELPGREPARRVATLRLLSDAADARSRTFEARFVLDGEAAARIPLGSTVTLTLPVDGTPQVRVPLSALHDAGQGPGVWLPDAQGAVHFRPVTVLALGAELATLGAGLQPGERIVAMGAHRLHEGMTVRVDAAPAMTGAAR